MAIALVIAAGLALGVPANARRLGAHVVVRERTDTTTSIGVEIEPLSTGRRFDRLIAQLPSGRRVTPALAPEGWNVEQKGKEIRASGPAVDQVRLRLDLDGSYMRDYLGKTATVRGGLSNDLDDTIKVIIEGLPKVETAPTFDGILIPPAFGTPGRPLLIGVAPDYRLGTWTATTTGGIQPVMPIESLRDAAPDAITPTPLGEFRGTPAFESLLSRPEPRPYVTFFPETGAFSRIRFVDVWGETLVDAPLTIAPTPLPAGPPVITGGSAFTFAGQPACVSGRFPDLGTPYEFRLDGAAALPVWGASDTSVMLGIPADAAAGTHEITIAGGTGSATVGVLSLEAGLDTTRLWRGESTTMRLRVVGTDRPMPLRIVNRTPSIISIDGGAVQTVATPGGADNALTRSVKGIQRGNFTIAWSVDAPPCGAP